MSPSKKTTKKKITLSPSPPKALKTKAGGAATGIEVDTTLGITKECTKALLNVFSDLNLGFSDLKFTNEQSLNEKLVRCRLVAEGARTVVTDKKTYLILPVLAGSVLYWIGIELDFKFTDTRLYRLNNASLVLFRGEADEYTPILRAEWDWWEHKGSTIHAQPHWHVYKSALGEVTVSDGESDEEMGLLDDDSGRREEERTRYDEFHFAMACTWHLDAANPPLVHINNSRNFVNWMSGCIAYTVRQLRYIHR